MGRTAWRQWLPVGGTGWHGPLSWSHVGKVRAATVCWGSETHSFIAEVEPLRPWEVRGDEGTGVSRSHPNSKSPLSFPTATPTWLLPLDPRTLHGRWRRFWRGEQPADGNFFPLSSLFLNFLFQIHRLFLVTLPHLLFPSFYDCRSEGPGLIQALRVLGSYIRSMNSLGRPPPTLS